MRLPLAPSSAVAIVPGFTRSVRVPEAPAWHCNGIFSESRQFYWGQSFGRPPESPVYPASRWGKAFWPQGPGDLLVVSSLSPVGVLGVVFCILASLRVCWSHVAVSWWSWASSWGGCRVYRAYSKDPEKSSLAFQV